jgi:hypothetical protein
MTVFQCPKCMLAFVSKNELEDHCRHDHENFHHEFRAAPPGPNDHLPAMPREEPRTGSHPAS